MLFRARNILAENMLGQAKSGLKCVIARLTNRGGEGGMLFNEI